MDSTTKKKLGYYKGIYDPDYARSNPELFLSSIPECTCNCRFCNDACRTAPCWGTPREIDDLMSRGFGNKLQLYVVHSGHYGLDDASFKQVDVISPAIYGNARGLSVSFGGKCCLLTKNGRSYTCELHDHNLKPVEGRVSHHEMTFDDAILIREALVLMWDTDYGKSVKDRWMMKHYKY